jgi:hypothetical protein
VGRSPAIRVAVCVVLAVAAFLGVRLATHGGQPGAFVVAGSRFVHPGAASDVPVTAHSAGYDGQFFYRLALDPLTRRVTARGVTLDNPPYRQQRIGYPALTWAVATVTRLPTPVCLLAVNAAAVVGLGWLGIAFSRRLGRSEWWGLALAATPAALLGLARDLGEPLALALLLGGLLLWLGERRWWAALAFSASALTRETMLPTVFGMGLYWLYRALARRGGATAAWRNVAALLVPGLVELAWQLYVRGVWGGGLPAFGPTEHEGLPLLVVAESFGFGVHAIGPTRAGALDLLWFAERIALAGLLVLVAVGLHRSRLPTDLRTGWVFAALIAVAVPWHQDIQFVRAAAEAVMLGQLLLLARRDLPSRAGLAGTVAWSAAISVAYALAL